jgi:hypothetical protein
MPIIQNFAMPAGNAVDLNFDVDPDEGVSMVGSNVFWSAFKQSFGVPQRSDLVIKKTSDFGIQVTDSALAKFTVSLEEADTVDLDPGNYYHEAVIVDTEGDQVTVTTGIMTITQTVINDFTLGSIP